MTNNVNVSQIFEIICYHQLRTRNIPGGTLDNKQPMLPLIYWNTSRLTGLLKSMNKEGFLYWLVMATLFMIPETTRTLFKTLFGSENL